ncbi:MAG: hypothetical protein HKN23_07280 [Verrucomicrobiales bacterium]|nr:hypothetical protein [Verrucomicrobiales bacterium]
MKCTLCIALAAIGFSFGGAAFSQEKGGKAPSSEALKEFEDKVQKQIQDRLAKEAAEKANAPVISPGVNVLVEFIEVQQADFAEWSLENPLPSNATPLRKAVQTWVKAGKGRLIEIGVVHARSGNRAKIESVTEIIYPTEYDPPEVPAAAAPVGAAKGGKGAAPPPAAIPAGRFPMTPPNPTAFETRNTGFTLEVDPVLGENGEIDLNLSPELVHQLKDGEVYETAIGDASLKVFMPTFSALKPTTQITLANGAYGLIAVGKLPPEKQSEDLEKPIVIMFVRADSL